MRQPRHDVKVVNECPLMAVISGGRCNTFTKTQNMARMLMNLKETLRFRSSRDRKDILLAIGDKYEAMIAADRASDAKYR